VRVDTFAYELPEELIAQRPAAEREQARLLHLSSASPESRHLHVADLPELLPAGALVVVNDTRVVPARLLGHKKSGGRVEIFLVRRIGTERLVPVGGGDGAQVDRWEALGRSNKPLRPGALVEVLARGARETEPPAMVVHVLGRTESGLLDVALSAPAGKSVEDAIRACGHVPLPPYIRRGDDDNDAHRYQTVYARADGAVAAPTAGLHITEGLLGRLRARGCEVAAVTLHVGLGTFQPVEVDDLDTHPMHSERCLVPPSTVEAIARARQRGAPVVAVGTTTARALESAADRARPGHAAAFEGDTRLLIQPGYAWTVVDALLTNFHLPRSTLLAMVCALGGTERVLGAYRDAVAHRYRFFSYGDAMLLWRSA
jgi:S-adenosylmethionine:tRNA ribosyltransferase-isomerase